MFVTPRKLASPFNVLSFIFVAVLALNVYFYYSYENTGAIQAKINDVESPEYVANINHELKTAKEQELLLLLQQDIAENNQDKFLLDLREQIVANFSDVLKDKLHEDIVTKYTTEYYEAKELNYELFDNLKAEYLAKHAADIKEQAILEVLSDISIKNAPEAFAKEVTEKFQAKLDKKKWYQSIINDLLIKHGPTEITPLTEEESGSTIDGTFYRDVQNPPWTKARLMKGHVNMGPKKFGELQAKHDDFVAAIKRLDEPPKEFVNGDGIVISGGGVYFGSALVAIGQMREMGAKLPIELIINNMEEYDEQICEELLPKTFNAKCIVVEREIGKELLDSLKLTKFQMKIFGLLFSTFNNIVTIDADNMPIKNVDHLLNSEPFLSTKFILWPDVWHKATSPQYYELARFKVGTTAVRRDGLANDWDYVEHYGNKDPEKDMAYHDLDGLPSMISIETGQMVFSKRSHFKSFLLSLYYNVYGPEFYYRLLFQGAPGDGDRETFVPALHLLQEPYHIVQHDTWLGGYRYEDKDGPESGFQETTIVQYDPTQNLKFFEDWQTWLKSKNLDPRLWPHQSNGYSLELLKDFKKEHAKKKTKEVLGDNGKMAPKEYEEPYKMPDVLFLHIHKPKINPIENTKTGSHGIYSRRNLGKPGYYPDYGTNDWELKFHSIAKWIACKGITSEHFWDKIANIKKEKVCEAVTNYVDFLKEDTEDIEASNLGFD